MTATVIVAADHAPTESWALVQAAQHGETDAFARLYGRYVGRLRSYVRARIFDPQLAEDLTSETFTRAFAAIRTVRYQGRDVGAWLQTIARNLIFDHLKAARRTREFLTDHLPECTLACETPEDRALAAASRLRLLAAIDGLSAHHRECIMFRFVHERTVAETATMMGRSEGAVKAMTHRAVRHLADTLADGEV